jgi:hypothetical protein
VNGTVSLFIVFFTKNLIFESLKGKQSETASLTVKQRLPLEAAGNFDVPDDWLRVGIQDIRETSAGGVREIFGG